MLSASVIDNSSPYGAVRFLAPFPEISTNNISHIQQVYQNLPQLGRSIILPVHYNRQYSQQTHPQIGFYPDYQMVSPYSSKVYMNSKNSKYINRPKHMDYSDNDFGDEFNKRDGHGHGGHGWDAGHHHHHGNSPALSALALLGFMFFLNLIQNSLQNNRQMLAAAAMNATTLGVIAGRMREKRDATHLLQVNMDTTESSFSSNLIKNLQNFTGSIQNSSRGIRKEENTRYKISTRSNQPPNSSLKLHRKSPKLLNNAGYVHTSSKPSIPAKTPTSERPIEVFKAVTLPCLQLLACKLGNYIFDKMDTINGIMFAAIGDNVVSRISEKTWTGQVMRAFNKGKDYEKCELLYKNCSLLNNQVLTFV